MDDERHSWHTGREQQIDSQRTLRVKHHHRWQQSCSTKFAENFERIFGAKPEQTETTEANKPPHACLHPTKEDIRRLVANVLSSTLPIGDLVGVAMRGLGGKANPSVVAAMIRELRAESAVVTEGER